MFVNNMSTYTRLSKAQISKIIQSGGSFGSWLGNLRKKALKNIAKWKKSCQSRKRIYFIYFK